MSKPTDNWNQCPICRSTNISADTLEADDREAWGEVDCLDCGATWTETYHATYRTNIRKGENRT